MRKSICRRPVAGLLHLRQTHWYIGEILFGQSMKKSILCDGARLESAKAKDRGCRGLSGCRDLGWIVAVSGVLKLCWNCRFETVL